MGVNGIYGLSGSGLDIESMVKVGMMSKQNEYDKMQQNYTLNEWKKEAYLDVYNKIQTYSTSTISQYKLQSNMNSRTATSSNAAITATATSAAPVMAHTLTVNQTATNAYLVGTNPLGALTDKVSAGNTISFNLYDTMKKASSVSFAGTDSTTGKFDADLMNNALLNTLGSDLTNMTATSISRVSTSGGNVRFTLLADDTNGDEVSKSVTKSADETALSFKVNGNDVNVTYGELAKLLSEPTYEFEFSDFVSLLNKKMESLGVTASHSDADNGALTFTNNQIGGTVSATINDDGIGGQLLSQLGHSETNKFAVSGSNGTSLETFMNEALASALGVSNATQITAMNYDAAAGDGGETTFSFLLSDGTTSTTTKAATETALSFNVGSENISFTYDNNFIDLFSNNAASGETANYEFDVVGGLIAKISDQLTEANISLSYENGALIFTDDNSTNTAPTVTFNNDGLGSYISANATQKPLVTWTETNSNQTTLDGYKTVSLNVTASTTYNDLAKAINNAGTNIRATFDSTNNLFSIYNKDSGAKNIVGIDIGTDANAQAVFNAMGLKQSLGSTSSSSELNFDTSKSKTSAVYTGKDASVLIDGSEVTDASNKITKNGVIYDITNVTSKTTATVNVTQDVDKIVDNVKSFVESYNTLLSDLYEMYNEKPNSSYKPLTDAQKNEMTEEQIEKWEKKAKAGMLYHDSTIRKLIDNMRTAVSEKVTSVGGKYDNSYSIGISTTGIYGQLTLDEDKLRAALTADPDSVSNVFTTLQSTTEERKNAAYVKSDGIAQRLGDIMNSSVKMITDVAGTSTDNSDDSTLSTLLRNLQSRMSSFRSMMDAFETKLYKKYDAMESSLAMLGSQLNYVTSSFGG